MSTPVPIVISVLDHSKALFEWAGNSCRNNSLFPLSPSVYSFELMSSSLADIADPHQVSHKAGQIMKRKIPDGYWSRIHQRRFGEVAGNNGIFLSVGGFNGASVLHVVGEKEKLMPHGLGQLLLDMDRRLDAAATRDLRLILTDYTRHEILEKYKIDREEFMRYISPLVTE